MSVSFATIVSLSASATLAIFGVALVFLVLWQDPRRRSNQYFALCMAIFAAYGAFNLPMQVAQQADIEPEPLLKFLSSLYVVGLVLLFSFILSFVGLPRALRWRERAISVPLGLGVIALIWAGRVFKDFQPLPDGEYRYNLTTIGWLSVSLAAVYLFGIWLVLRRIRTPQAREFVLPITLMVVGVLGFSAIPSLRRYSLNALMMMVAVVMLGRIVLKYQVFKPLADLVDALDAKNQELQDAMNARARFFANMSHELRTPLNSIIGYSELVLRGTYGTMTDLQQDRLLKVERNGRSLLQLINAVLDLSKIEAGRLELNLKEIATNALLDSLISEYQPQVEQKKLSLVRGYGQLPNVCADPDRIRQVLSAVLSHAIRLTDAGAIIVRGHLDMAQQQVVLVISDTSPGLPPDRQKRLFNVYMPADMPDTPVQEKTDLDLALAYQLIQMQSGRLWVNSAPGQGSSFHIALPVAKNDGLAPRILEPRHQKGALVLAIDDDMDALELLRDHLERANFRVCGANNANDGLRLAHELCPALITLDVLMPGIDGWQALEALRRDPVTAAIPVIILSAKDDDGRAASQGAGAFIRKPVQPDQLLTEIRRLIAPPATVSPQESRS
jgi:signal transduction histidine kinase/ActR/RegA family two-component response regulator